jgi:hypothetical protein
MLIIKEITLVTFNKELISLIWTILLDIWSTILRDQIIIFIAVTSDSWWELIHNIILVKESTITYDILFFVIDYVCYYLWWTLRTVTCSQVLAFVLYLLSVYLMTLVFLIWLKLERWVRLIFATWWLKEITTLDNEVIISSWVSSTWWSRLLLQVSNTALFLFFLCYPLAFLSRLSSMRHKQL